MLSKPKLSLLFDSAFLFFAVSLLLNFEKRQSLLFSVFCNPACWLSMLALAAWSVAWLL